jgi:hypothetical protein
MFIFCCTGIVFDWHFVLASPMGDRMKLRIESLELRSSKEVPQVQAVQSVDRSPSHVFKWQTLR